MISVKPTINGYIVTTLGDDYVFTNYEDMLKFVTSWLESHKHLK